MPSVFDHLAPDERASVFAGLVRRRYGAGEFVLHQGGPPSAMYVIEQGQADVLKADGDGVTRFVCRLGEGETFGEMSMLTGEPVSASIRASTLLDVLQLNAEDMRRIGRLYPALFHNLATILAMRLGRVNEA
jgi:CRP-like cAMP-binding protein